MKSVGAGRREHRSRRVRRPKRIVLRAVECVSSEMALAQQCSVCWERRRRVMEVHVVAELFSLVSPQWLSLLRSPTDYYYLN